MFKLLENKIAIVTGAARGIGREIAEKYSEHGAVVYALDIKKDDLSWTDSFQNIYGIAVDICDFSAVKTVVMSIKKEYGRIDILVNNAGLISYEMMSMIDYDRFRKMIDVNVVALIYIMQLVSRIMSRQNEGVIINMTSMVAVKGCAGQLSYSATKGAVISATKSAAKELAKYKIRVNAIAPGMVETERFKAVLEKKFSQKINDIPFGRLADSEDIANAALYFASDMAVYVTGQVLGVDGGVNI